MQAPDVTRDRVLQEPASSADRHAIKAVDHDGRIRALQRISSIAAHRPEAHLKVAFETTPRRCSQ
jgi:hypothetical protein